MIRRDSMGKKINRKIKLEIKFTLSGALIGLNDSHESVASNASDRFEAGRQSLMEQFVHAVFT